MKKNSLFLVLIIAVIVVGVFIIFSGSKTRSPDNRLAPPEQHEYFWSDTCPHCAKVAEFIDGWEKKDKFVMNKYEVNESTANRIKFMTAGKLCKIRSDDLGVPLLITPSGQCFIGDEPIIQYLKSIEL